jgi:hypothetical protein
MNYEERTLNWWYCDNIVHPKHEGHVGLLHLGSPSVFVLIRDYADMYFRSYEEFSEHIAEVNFLYPEEREETDIDALLIDAWNFMALQERRDEELADEWDDEEQ